MLSLGRDDPETSDWGASTDHNFTTNKRRPASVETVKMSDSASNMSKPNLDTPTEKMSEPQQGAEQAIEVAMPASEEKVAPAPRGPALAGPEAQFQVFPKIDFFYTSKSFFKRQWLGIRYRIFSLWARDTVQYP